MLADQVLEPVKGKAFDKITFQHFPQVSQQHNSFILKDKCS